MNRLEERYRRVLRLLPVAYRQKWEEDMVATFLLTAQPKDPDEAEFAADYGSPSWLEIASVVALAVRLRLGGVGAPARYLFWGDAVRRVALMGLLLHAVTALLAVVALLLRVVTLLDYLQFAARGADLTALVTIGLVEAMAVLAVAGVLTTVAKREMRRLSW